MVRRTTRDLVVERGVLGLMGEAIGEVLTFGVGVALSPAAIVALAVMPVAPGRARRVSAFVGAWVLSLAQVATLALLLADVADASRSGAPATWVSILKIVISLCSCCSGSASGGDARAAKRTHIRRPGFASLTA